MLSIQTRIVFAAARHARHVSTRPLPPVSVDQTCGLNIVILYSGTQHTLFYSLIFRTAKVGIFLIGDLCNDLAPSAPPSVKSTVAAAVGRRPSALASSRCSGSSHRQWTCSPTHIPIPSQPPSGLPPYQYHSHSFRGRERKMQRRQERKEET